MLRPTRANRNVRMKWIVKSSRQMAVGTSEEVKELAGRAVTGCQGGRLIARPSFKYFSMPREASMLEVSNEQQLDEA